jgi:hypothetical protein
MATAKPLPVQIELRQTDYLVLLKHAKNRSRVAARLIAAGEHESKRGVYLFTGLVTDGLGLRAVALVHARKALPAIERGLKQADKA